MVGYNLHRGSGNNISEYDVLWMSVLGDDGKPIASGKWITAKKASEETGFSQEFSTYTHDGRIRMAWVSGRKYLFAEDVDRELKVPKGWWDLEATVLYTHVHPDHLRRLVRTGQITGETVHKENWFEPDALKQYFDAPKGFVTYETAKKLFGIGKKAIRRLAEDGKIETAEIRGRKYFNLVNLREHFKIPDGYMITIQAAEEFHYDLSRINEIARENNFPRITIGNSTYFPRTLMEQYLQKRGLSNGKVLAAPNSGSNGQNGDGHGSLADLMKGTRPMQEEDIGHSEAGCTGIVRIIASIYDEEAPKHQSSKELAIAIAKRLSVENGHNGSSNPGVPLDLIKRVVNSFE